MKTSNVAPRPAPIVTAQNNAATNAAATTAAPAASLPSPTDAWVEGQLGRYHGDDASADLRAFAPVAAKLARARASAEVRPLYVEALELHMLSSRLASFAFRGARAPGFDEVAAGRELDKAERSPVTNVVAFLAGGKRSHHLSEKEILRLIEVSVMRGLGPSMGLFSREPSAEYHARIDDAVERYVAETRKHLEGTSPLERTREMLANRAEAAARPQPARPADNGGPLASFLGVRVYIEGEKSGPFRDTRTGSEMWRDLEPL